MKTLSLPHLRCLVPLVTLFVWVLIFSPADAEATGPRSSDEVNTSSYASALHDRDRNEELIANAQARRWGAAELFSYLELDAATQCQDFSDRVFLAERHARWREAVWLLAEIDGDALERWLLGLSAPPAIAKAETTRQLRCLMSHLVTASRLGVYNIRIFPQIRSHFGGSVASAQQLADLVEERPVWLERTVNAVTRSLFRDMGTQGFIWYRKFRLEGRPFNLVSAEAAQICGIAAAQTWKPDHPAHQRCWHQRLTPQQREQEILIASAAPGLSRHHWGTDVDILGLNPHLFTEGGPLFDDWRWLDTHALDHGFFQPYRGASENLSPAHMEERWHWSYYPIAQALWDFVREHPERFEELLFTHWDRLERRWGRGKGPFFDHMRENWQAYLFHIDVPLLMEERSVQISEF